jgi:hypothetical protein
MDAPKIAPALLPYMDVGYGGVVRNIHRPASPTSQAMPATALACAMAFGGAKHALLKETTSPL